MTISTLVPICIARANRLLARTVLMLDDNLRT
jgi:hypothetical protein